MGTARFVNDDGTLSSSMITVMERFHRVAVTKSGKHIVGFSIINKKFKIASLDGTSIRWSESGEMKCCDDGEGVLVDSEGLIWVRQPTKISCFTEDGQLVRVVQLKFHPTVMASLPDGRLLVHDNHGVSRLLLVSPECEHPVIFIESSVHLPNAIHDLQVCVQTGEIYVLSHKGEVSIFSSADGKFCRSFSCAPWCPWAMVLSADGRHIFFYEPPNNAFRFGHQQAIWFVSGHWSVRPFI